MGDGHFLLVGEGEEFLGLVVSVVNMVQEVVPQYSMRWDDLPCQIACGYPQQEYRDSGALHIRGV